jgi:hypothetical protein
MADKIPLHFDTSGGAKKLRMFADWKSYKKFLHGEEEEDHTRVEELQEGRDYEVISSTLNK